MGCCSSLFRGIFRKSGRERPSEWPPKTLSSPPTDSQYSSKPKRDGLISKVIDMFSELTSKEDQKPIKPFPDKLRASADRNCAAEEDVFWNELVKRQKIEMEEKERKLKEEQRKLREANQELKRIEDEMRQVREEQEKWINEHLRSKRAIKVQTASSIDDLHPGRPRFDKNPSISRLFWIKRQSSHKNYFQDDSSRSNAMSHDSTHFSSHNILKMELVQKLPDLNSDILSGMMCDPQEKDLYYIGNYQILNVIGRGCCGKVLLVADRDSGLTYAMKVVKKHIRYGSIINSEKTFMESMAQTWHPFIVKIFSCHQTAGHIFFVMEYLEGRSLHFSLSVEKRFAEPKTVFYSACILMAIGYLHNCDICHRDIKLENVVLDRFGYPKLIDFGMAVIGVKHNTPILDKSGTKLYQGPEFLIPGMITRRSSDFWGLGVIIHAMLTGKFIAVLPVLVMDSKALSRNAYDLLKKLFQTNPLERLGAGSNGAKDIMKHAFFRNTKWDDLLTRRIAAPPLLVKPMEPLCLKNEWDSLQNSKSNFGSFVWDDIQWVEMKEIKKVIKSAENKA